MRALQWLILPLLLITLAGCKSTPRIDWDSRVGHYTYDQAVLDLGPPDRETTLSDSSRVAEWVTGQSRRPRLSLGMGTGVSTGRVGTGVGVGVPVVGGGYEALRLTFDSQGTLTRWGRTR
jgi:hypothetical protein